MVQLVTIVKIEIRLHRTCSLIFILDYLTNDTLLFLYQLILRQTTFENIMGKEENMGNLVTAII